MAKKRKRGSSGSARIKSRAIELYHRDSPFKPKVVQDKRKKPAKYKKLEVDE